MNQIINHYDLLIDENIDPVHDAQILRDYMDKWDGQVFFDLLQLDKYKTVFEIGVGTGRLAIKIIPNCKHFTGIDFSPKTIERATQNLTEFENKMLICADFFEYNFTDEFDIIYSSLVLWHIKEKQKFIEKASNLIKDGGRFVLSIGNEQSKELNYGIRKIPMFPDNIEDTKAYLEKANFKKITITPVEFGTIFTAEKII